MAKIRKIYDQTIKPDGEQTVVYPITSTRAVYTPESVTVDHLLGEGYRFGGILEPTTAPTVTDQRVYYLADTVGFYYQCGNIEVNPGELAVLMYDKNQWRKGTLKGGGVTITGYKLVASVEELPLEPSTYGYLIDNDLYVWVGEGGDTLDGLYQDAGPFRGPEGPRGLRGYTGATGRTGAQGPKGAKGDKGDKGDSGASLGQLTLVNGLSQGTAGVGALDAYQGKILNESKIGFTSEQSVEEIPDLYYTKPEVDSLVDSNVRRLDASINANTELVEQLEDSVEHLLDDYAPIVIEGDVTNAPDEEDITSKSGLLKFKDRLPLDGMGYKILRKGLSVQSQMNQINTIYEIRYDFDLSTAYTDVLCEEEANIDGVIYYHNAEAIPLKAQQTIFVPGNCVILNEGLTAVLGEGEYTPSSEGNVYIANTVPDTYYYNLSGYLEVPNNCVLKFEGGRISNGTIIGQDTDINAGLVKIFNTNVTLSGTWNVAELYPEWFGAKGDGVTDDYNAVNKCILFSSNIKKHAAFKEKAVYKILSISSTNIFKVDGSLYIKGNNATISVGDVGDYECIIRCVYPDNYVHIENLVITTSETNLPPSPGGGGILETNRRIDCSVGGTRDHIGTIEIDNVTINNAHGVWQYDLESGRGYLRNCTINYTTAFSPTYDRTSIYINCNGFECYNNNLNGSSAARTGIEYHGNNIRVHDNYINNYNVPIDIVNDNSKMESISVLENLSLYNNYINSRRGVVLWFTSSNVGIDSIIISDNTIITTDSGDTHNGAVQFYEVMGQGVNVNNLIIRNNHFEQKGSGTRAIIRIGSNTSNSSCEFKRIIIDGNVMISKTSARVINYESWAPGQNYKEVSFINNIIDCNNKTLLRGFDGNGCFKNTIFENNIVKNNVADIFLVGSAPGIYIFKSNLYDVEPSKSRPSGFTGTYINTDVNLGDSDMRPVDNKIGFQYFDTSLGKPIYWNGSAWVDATGTPV